METNKIQHNNVPGECMSITANHILKTYKAREKLLMDSLKEIYNDVTLTKDVHRLTRKYLTNLVCSLLIDDYLAITTGNKVDQLEAMLTKIKEYVISAIAEEKK